MSKATELRLIERSISGDARRTLHHRSGDGEGEGAELWDVVAQAPSAEEEMIAAEEAAERRAGQKRGIKFLRVYLRQVFDARERELIRAILEARDGQTVRESAAGIGLDITEGVRVRRSILRKWDRTGERLLAALRSFGFGAWRYLDFLSALKQAEEISQKYYTDLEGNRAKRRAYYAANKEKARFYYAAHREEILAKLRSEWTEHIEENRAKSRAAWRRRVEKNREEILRKQAERRRKNREAVNARQREYYRTHKSQEYARIRAYQQAHPEKVRKWSRESRKRSRTARAAKKQEASKKDR